MQAHVSKSTNLRGYAAMLEENTNPTARGDLHESFDIALEVPADDSDVLAGKVLYGPNQWPENRPVFRKALETYYAEMITLSHHLLHAFALALGLKETYFDAIVTKPLATLRVLIIRRSSARSTSARSASAPIPTMSASPSSPSRWAFRRCRCSMPLASGSPPIRWKAASWSMSATRWRAGPMTCSLRRFHRAINRSGKERYSIPFFFGRNYDTIVEVLPSCVDEAHPAKYPPISSGDYVNGRFTATFASYASQQQDAPIA
ncbi:isopenicillin N synthase-like dioxygenase [Phyllobacterium bourgognense]|uniref:Isopenicillin N synthase-like dioxygenase n=1 Tax=Phyllobacterium bourgognense TaxID=314236 RepID=A0A368YM30_9HYPH|nr:isopenicillin N synthase-like dioxygenase [Phyllobacterium bourgognense]